MCAKQPAELTMFILLVLLLLCYGVGNIQCSTVHENNIDLHSLLDFKKGITDDPRGVLSSWNTSIHYCRWRGLTCTPTRPWRVSGLNLTGQSLAGEITSSLANLTFLSFLDLSSNRFFGQFPLLNHLKQLDTLNTSFNSLEGTIPDALTNCSNLRKIDLSRNLLHGAIPPKIDSLTNLEYLNLGSNNLTGIIPATVRNLTQLNYVRLNDNKFEGRIPDGLWQLPNLSYLVLGGNMLSGEIPHALNLSRLNTLGLELNMLGNVLPSNFGDALPNLQVLYLDVNKFEGHIPTSLGNASELLEVDFSFNNFTGQIPTSFGKLSSLFFLNLEQNQLEARDNQGWEFLFELRNCRSLKTLSLYENNLQGSIPHSISNISVTLQYLLLGGNNLSGIVPPSIGNFSNLINLGLDSNSFSGEIGEWVGKLKNLQGLWLLENKFIGPIPPSIGNLSLLTRLSLQKNKFEGLVPPSIGHLSQLEVLNLGYNNLQGSIPVEVGNLEQLIELHLSSNKLTGEIPDALGQCLNLAHIQMDQNFLTGNIPVTLGKIKGLNGINLSHNNLSGTIPRALNDLPLLTMLDLSYNDLQGEIPRNGVFENATAVSLDGNRGLCGGAMNLHMPSCPAVSQRIERRYSLIKILIPIFGFMSLVLLFYFLLLRKKTSRRTHVPLPLIGENFPKVSYKDLAQATRNFSASNLIGRGSYGSVYRGKLEESQTDVAVKVFDLEMRGAERSFMSECEALRGIQHRNLLRIITCLTVDREGNAFNALVYKFMPNGSLDRWLHHKGDTNSPKHLGLTQRISIAVNIADALDYLHHDCGRPTIHCDLKPSNILLDDDMTALLGDFGIARFYADSWLASTGSIGVKGTIGYIAPEYGGGGHASTSGDVYSFGIVLLEIMTGRRPTDPMFKDGLDIVTFVSSNVPHQIYHVIDPHLIEECRDLAQVNTVLEHAVFQDVVSLLEVALSCTSPLPSERMNMKQIASKLHAIKTSYLG